MYYYTETALLFSNNYHTDIQQLLPLPCFFTPSLSTESESTVKDYEFGHEGDLFNTPELPIIEDEPLISLDPTPTPTPTPTAAENENENENEISMISFGGELIHTQELLQVQDIQSSFDFGQLLSEVFYECNKDIILPKEDETTTTKPLSHVLQVQPFHLVKDENTLFSQGLLGKSCSAGCLSSMEKIPETSAPPDFLHFHGMDLEVVNGMMRRAFSEGDLEILGNGSSSSMQCNISAAEQQQITINCSSEDRMEKLLRYRNKKAKRNFGRKIKYACRKALADNQPRIRGRFAKTGH